jgi:hypothetical protein
MSTEEGHGDNGSSPPRATLVDSSASSPGKTQVKLLKLELKKFNGDHSKWISFWDTFEASVHKNENLSPIDKFNYLISLLERSAAEAISGLTLTASNYVTSSLKSPLSTNWFILAIISAMVE